MVISVVMGVIPLGHVILTNGRHLPSFFLAVALAMLHYGWLINGDEFKRPLDPLYITLDTLLLHGLLYGAFVSCTLLL